MDKLILQIQFGKYSVISLQESEYTFADPTGGECEILAVLLTRIFTVLGCYCFNRLSSRKPKNIRICSITWLIKSYSLHP